MHVVYIRRGKIPFLNCIIQIIFFLSFLFTAYAYPQDVKDYEFAGSFYPRDKNELSVLLDSFMSRAKVTPIRGNILGAICPHAGYIYSGPVAAYSYKAISSYNAGTINILAPSHH